MSQYKQIADKYKFINKIASGSFGEVYLAKDKKTNKIYAAKIETKSAKSRLHDEHKIYKNLKEKGFKEGIPKVLNFIETKKQNILIMQLLGKDLDDLHKQYNNKFDIGTVLKLGVDIINLLEKLHKTGYIHRDIKPNNFLTGYETDNNNLYIMDFGLSKQYIINDQHIKIKIERDLVGTARYASINVHLGIEPSRRDDLISVGYMLIYFLQGKLPWQGLKEKKNVDKIQLIGDTKLHTHVKKLCDGLPSCFINYLEYCKKLDFTDEPDYKYLKSLFLEESVQNNINLQYCWLNNESLSDNDSE